MEKGSKHQHAMLVFLKLAVVSQRKMQISGRDQFLMLTMVEADLAGLDDVAELAFTVTHEISPHLLLGNFPTVQEMLRSEQFVPFLKKLRRFCSLERAELLLGNQHWKSRDSEVGHAAEACQLLSELLDLTGDSQ